MWYMYIPTMQSISVVYSTGRKEVKVIFVGFDEVEDLFAGARKSFGLELK